MYVYLPDDLGCLYGSKYSIYTVQDGRFVYNWDMMYILLYKGT